MAPHFAGTLAEETVFDAILKNFAQPDHVIEFKKGKFETVNIFGRKIGLATYEPGWKWSEHVGSAVDEPYRTVEHLGFVLSGCAAVEFADGRIIEMEAGDVFYVPAAPHDSWVTGSDAYVSLHILGANSYAR